MAHWHSHNPWADRLVYIPSLEELAVCLMANPAMRVQSLLRWQELKRADAYILPKATAKGFHEAGIRFGPDGPDYLSPFCSDAALDLLLRKYRSNAPS